MLGENRVSAGPRLPQVTVFHLWFPHRVTGNSRSAADNGIDIVFTVRM